MLLNICKVSSLFLIWSGSVHALFNATAYIHTPKDEEVENPLTGKTAFRSDSTDADKVLEAIITVESALLDYQHIHGKLPYDARGAVYAMNLLAPYLDGDELRIVEQLVRIEPDHDRPTLYKLPFDYANDWNLRIQRGADPMVLLLWNEQLDAQGPNRRFYSTTLGEVGSCFGSIESVDRLRPGAFKGVPGLKHFTCAPRYRPTKKFVDTLASIYVYLYTHSVETGFLPYNNTSSEHAIYSALNCSMEEQQRNLVIAPEILAFSVKRDSELVQLGDLEYLNKKVPLKALGKNEAIFATKLSVSPVYGIAATSDGKIVWGQIAPEAYGLKSCLGANVTVRGMPFARIFGIYDLIKGTTVYNPVFDGNGLKLH